MNFKQKKKKEFSPTSVCVALLGRRLNFEMHALVT
jgi:hypothetical protein